MPKISVVVPIYKTEKFLSECIESILSQTYKDFELLLIDDESPDKCPDICDFYSKIDNRVVVLHKKNGGLSSSRNAGIKASKGNFITFVDSDDVIHPLYLEELYRLINCKHSEISSVNYVTFSDITPALECSLSTEKRFCISLSKEEYWTFDFKNSQSIISCGKLFKRELFDDILFDENRYHEDEFIIHKLIDKCNCITITLNALYFYRKRSGSITTDYTFLKLIDAFDALDDRFNFFMEKGYKDEILKRAFSKLFLLYVRLYKSRCCMRTEKSERRRRKKAFYNAVCIYKIKHKINTNIKIACRFPKLYLILTKFYKF